MEKIQDIHMLLFQRLALSEANFDPFAYMKHVSQLKTNKARIDFVYEALNKHQLFPKVAEDVKNDSLAEEHRRNGRRYFDLGYFSQALEDYTRSVATSRSNAALALAYSDRSASLCKLGLYKEGIVDIERALEIGPKSARSKLRIRQNRAKRQCGQSDSYFEEISKFRNSEKNSAIQCASNCVRIEGRHVVAVRNIQVGEIVAIEEPYATVLTAGQLIHCHHCLELCYNPIPCDNCTFVLYCSRYCKNKAWNYHEFECVILLTIREMALESALVPLRTAILARDEYEKLHRTVNTDYYCSDRYREIHNLNTSLEFLEDELYCFLTTVKAAVLLYLLKTRTNFFENATVEDMFKEVIMRQLHNAEFYCVKISENARNTQTLFYERQYFADGLYAFFSLFNHSCCNNIIRSFHGSTIILRALNTIKEGEQCFVNYGCHYGTTPKPIRQRFLRKGYFFECKCRACEENWKPDCVNLQLIHNYNFFDVHKKLASLADVSFAKYLLKKLIAALKKCEKYEPNGKALLLKTRIIQCYEILGNKRRI